MKYSVKKLSGLLKFLKVGGRTRSFFKNRDSKFFYEEVLPEDLLHLNQKAASYSLKFQLQMVRWQRINMILFV